MYMIARSARRGDARVAQVARHRARILRERDLRFGDLGMPPLLPLEAVVAPVTDTRERGDLPLHRHLARSREHVLPILPIRHRVLEVRVADVLPERSDGRLGLLAGDEGVMRI